MSIYLVTITGADDSVRPKDLCQISYDYPFVEWGILYSASRCGQPRYPSLDWRRRFIALREQHSYKLSRHLCGRIANGAMQGVLGPFAGPDGFDRFQINGYQSPTDVDARHILLDKIASISTDRQVILQCRSEDTLQQVANDAQEIPYAAVLFDPSGGRGLEPMRWPPAPIGCHIGFAGGITPDNVLDVIKDIGPRDPYWIDMESGVRTGEVFDLDKVRRVLSRVAPFVREVT